MFKSFSGPPAQGRGQQGSRILHGRSFYVLGSLNDVMSVNSLLEKLGGKRAWGMSSAEGLLTQATAVKDVAYREKLISAVERDIPVVDGRAWLTACAKRGRQVDWEEFVLEIPAESLRRERGVEPPPVVSCDSVRSASDTPSDEDAGFVIPQSAAPPSPREDREELSEELGDDDIVYTGPMGLPDGASSKAIFAKHGSARPAGVQGGGFVRQLSTAELHSTTTNILDYRILHCCVMSENKNKFYVMELTDDNGSHRIVTHYGRTDDLEMDPNSGRREVRVFKTAEAAGNYFGQLCTEKYNIKKYRDVALLTTTVGTRALQKLVEEKHKPSTDVTKMPPFRPTKDVLEVVDHLYNEASTALSSVLSAKITARGITTPLGVLAKEQIEAGANILSQLHSLISSGVAKNELTKLSSEFYTLIPHKLGSGMAAVSVCVITSDRQVQDKLELLQLMRDISKLSKAASGDEALLKYSTLNNEMAMLNPAVEECNMIKKIVETQARTTGVRVARVFRISRDAEHERFDVSVPQRVKLLHGSRPGNMVGILSRGLLLPKAAAVRTNFGWLGAGIYFTDHGCSASRYAAKSSNGKCYAVVATVSLGNVKEVTDLHPTLTEPPAGHDTVKGLGREMPGGPKESIFDDNEYVVYKENRFTLDYLVEMDIMQPLGLPKEVDVPLIIRPAVKATKSTKAAPVALSGGKTQQAASTTFGSFANPAAGAGSDPLRMMKLESAMQFLTSRVSSLEVTAGKVDMLEGMVAELKLSGATAMGHQQMNWAPTAPGKRIASKSPKAPVSAPSVFAASAPSARMLDGAMCGMLTNEELKTQELSLRGKYARGETAGPHEFLIDVFSNVNTFKYESFTPEEQQYAKLLYQYVKQPELDGNSIVAPDVCAQNLETLTGGQFKGMNWDNLFLAGGGVLGAMLPPDAGTESAFRGSDLDLFMYGIETDEEALEKVRHIISVVGSNRKEKKNPHAKVAKVLRTPHAITILGMYPYRHVQIVLRMYKSPSEVLIGFDIDACTVGFDGARVWANPRARRAINKQMNTVDMTRRSLTYEVRLAKYAKRGFAVGVPGVQQSRLLDVRAPGKLMPQTEGLRRLLALNAKENDICAALRRTSMQKKWAKRGLRRKRERVSRQTRREESDWSGSTEEESILGMTSDYSNVLTPYGPLWNTWRLEVFLCKKDKSQYFANIGCHRHIAMFGKDALEGKTHWCAECSKKPSGPQDFDCDITEAASKFVFGRPKWMREDPGKQLMTGSFHPVTDDKWFEGAVSPTDMPTCVTSTLYRMGISAERWNAPSMGSSVGPAGMGSNMGPGMGSSAGFGGVAPAGFGGFGGFFGAPMKTTARTKKIASKPMKKPAMMPSMPAKPAKMPTKKTAGFHTMGEEPKVESLAFGVPSPVPGLRADVTLYGKIAVVVRDGGYCGSDKVVCLSMHMAKNQYDFAHIRDEDKVPVFFGVADDLAAMSRLVQPLWKLKSTVFVVALGQGWYSMPNPVMKAVAFNHLKINPSGPVVYVGHRAREYHDMDYRFAVNCGMEMQTPECYFKNEAPGVPPAQVFDPRTTLDIVRKWLPARAGDPTVTLPWFCTTSDPWMVLMVGPPGAGKSSFVERHLKKTGMVQISRDIQGDMRACLDLFASVAPTRCSVVIDNLNSSKEKRAQFIKAAKALGYKCGCIHLDTPVAVAKHNNKLRPWVSAGKIEAVPDIVYNLFTRDFEQPQMSEGFEEDAIFVQPFVAEFDTQFHEKTFMLLP